MNIITSFKFKPIKAKKVSIGIKRISAITQGLVTVENGEYKCHIFADDNTTSSGDIILPFTERSYDLKGRETIFDKVRNDDEKKIRYIRTHVQALTFPGDPNKFVPFGPNWIIKGYIVEKENKKYFDFVDLLTINGYN